MFLNLRLAPWVLAISALISTSHSSALDLLKQRDECVENGGSGSSTVVVYISTNVVQYPVFINTYIADNTVININGGYTIVINNAPTYLNTVVTATATTTEYSTVTVTNTATSIATASTASAVPSPFAIAISPTVNGKKRQSTVGYIGLNSNGVAIIVADKSAAASFFIDNGQLSADGGFVGLTESALSAGFSLFEIFNPAPFISETFTYTLGGSVNFQVSSTQFSGFTQFCISESQNELFIILNNLKPAPNCIPVSLVAELPPPINPTSTTSTPTISSSAAPTISSSAAPATSSSAAPTTSSSAAPTTSSFVPPTISFPAPPTTTSSATSTSTPNPSDDLDNEPIPIPTAPPARRFVKKTIPRGNMRRGGVFRSPLKANL